MANHTLTHQPLALSQTPVKDAARLELALISTSARKLLGPGRQLMPLKPEMLERLPDDVADMIMRAAEMIFAACLQYVSGQLRETSTEITGDAVGLVAARIDIATAEATCTALLHGPTAALLILACEHAPIAMHAILQICPELSLKNRLIDRKRDFSK